MSDSNFVKYLGDSLFDINGKTVDVDQVAQNIVRSQDGGSIDRIIRENSDHTCDYRGDNVWVFDQRDECDSEEIANYLSAILSDLNEHCLIDIVGDYCTIID